MGEGAWERLFRLIPTAYIGILLAGVTLATGSIFPAMLWHALNNAAALVPSHLGWWDPETTLPGWAYALAAVVLVLALALVWMNPTPYPGLKGSAATATARKPRDTAPAGG